MQEMMTAKAKMNVGERVEETRKGKKKKRRNNYLRRRGELLVAERVGGSG